MQIACHLRSTRVYNGWIWELRQTKASLYGVAKARIATQLTSTSDVRNQGKTCPSVNSTVGTGSNLGQKQENSAERLRAMFYKCNQIATWDGRTKLRVIQSRLEPLSVDTSVIHVVVFILWERNRDLMRICRPGITTPRMKWAILLPRWEVLLSQTCLFSSFRQ